MGKWSAGRALGWTCAALTALLLGQVLSRATVGYGETAVATVFREEKTCVTGTVLRQEETVTLPETGNYIPAVESGKRVGAGQALLIEEKSPEAAEAARQVRMLRGGLSEKSIPLVTRRQQLREAIRRINGGDGRVRRAQAETLGSLSRAEWETGSLKQALSAAEAELLRVSKTAGKACEVPASGIFSSAWDGLETGETVSLPLSERTAGTAGRLVTGDTWYFQTVLPEAVEEGDYVTLELLCGIFAPARFYVEEVEKTQAGYACSLSCRAYLSEVSELRILTAAFLQTGSGLEIPARGVYTVDGTVGVWCLVGDSPCFKPVTVIKELEDTVVVELDRSSTENLWPGDTVLLDMGE